MRRPNLCSTRTLKDASGSSILHAAAIGGSVETAALLKHHFQGIDIDENDAGPTRLMLASLKEHTDFMKYLLDKDANRTDITKDYWTLLHFVAVKNKTSDAARLLGGRIPLKDHWHWSNVKTLEQLTPLMIAAEWGREDVFDLLLTFKVDIRLRERQGNTAAAIAEGMTTGPSQIRYAESESLAHLED